MNVRSGNTFNATVGTSAGVLVGASDHRVALLIFSAPNARFTLGANANVVLDQGPTIQQAMAPTVFTYERDGEFVRKPIWAIGSQAGIIVGMVEIMETR